MFRRHPSTLLRLIFAGMCLLLGASHALAAGGEGGHHGLTQDAPVLLDLGFFKVTNSMVATWIVAALLIVVAQLATKKARIIPTGLQNFVEMLVEGLYNFMEDILGKELNRRTFWFFATVFLFIVSANWFALIPGTGSIGWGVPDAEGNLGHLSRPLLRGANADLNMTLGMAAVFMVLWVVWSIQMNGVGGFLKHIFWPAEGRMGWGLAALLFLPFMFAGILEIVSIAFRPISLSFRLYGNIFAGENMLESMALISKWFGWLIAVPFYFLELLVGLVQALVFTLLTAVFTVLMCGHGDDHGHAAEGGPAH